jgi:hypothetical protein
VLKPKFDNTLRNPLYLPEPFFREKYQNYTARYKGRELKLEGRIRDAVTLKEDFIALLDQQGGEQEYQEFIEKNTALVPREFIQNHGVHLDVVFRKLSLAADYTTDFFYLSKSSVDWNCILIEIEKPQSKYFKGDSINFHPDFQAALEQINCWRAWFSNRSNFDGFVNGTISLLRGPGHWMWQNACYIKYVLVHGRRAEFEGNEIRRRLISGQERDDFHILSYDSLVESLHSKTELYVARRKNDHIEVLSNRFVSEGLLTGIAPSYLKITDELRQSALDNKKSWHELSLGGGWMLEHRLPKIGSFRVHPDVSTADR